MEQLAVVVRVSIVTVSGARERRPNLSYIELDSIGQSVCLPFLSSSEKIRRRKEKRHVCEKVVIAGVRT